MEAGWRRSWCGGSEFAGRKRRREYEGDVINGGTRADRTRFGESDPCTDPRVGKAEKCARKVSAKLGEGSSLWNWWTQTRMSSIGRPRCVWVPEEALMDAAETMKVKVNVGHRERER